MRIFESTLEFESVPERAVGRYVRDPNHRNHHEIHLVQKITNDAHEKWKRIRMREIVDTRSPLRIDEIPEHRDIRRQNQKNKQPPARSHGRVDPQSKNKKHRAFDPLEEDVGHAGSIRELTSI